MFSKGVQQGTRQVEQQVEPTAAGRRLWYHLEPRPGVIFTGPPDEEGATHVAAFCTPAELPQGKQLW